MADNKHHIDKSLRLKLGQLEQAPSNAVWSDIEHFLNHTEHPIDQGLHTFLSDFEPAPDTSAKSTILNDHKIQTHIIDQALNNRLSQLETTPAFNFENSNIDSKKRRRFLPLWIAGIGVFCITVFLVSQSLKNAEDLKDYTSTQNQKNTEGIQNNIFKNNQNDASPEDLENIGIKQEKNPQYNRSEKSTNLISTVEVPVNIERKSADLIHSEIPIETHELKENSSESDKRNLDIKLAKEQSFEFNAEQTKRIGSNLHIPKVRRLPFQIGIWYGYYIETRVKEDMNSEYVHHDGLNLLNQGNARNKSGRSFQVDFNYNFGNRFSISAGLQQSKASGSSEFDYIYADIPVYDTLGKISGYITRPPQSSPHLQQEVRSEITNWVMPVSMKFSLLKIGRWQLLGGLGSSFQLSSIGQYSGLNFKNSKIEQRNFNKGFKVSPNATISFRTPIHPMFSISIDYRVDYRRASTSEMDKYIKGKELTNSFQIGLIFQPIIKR